MRSDTHLDDACLLIVDCPHNTVKTSTQVYAYAVGTKAIADGRIDFTQARPVDEATYRTWIKRGPPREGDLILCREAPVGPVARVPGSPRACLGQRTVLLRPNPEVVDGDYLLYTLQSPSSQRALLALAEGSTVVHLNVADVRSFPLSLPSVDEQARIAGVLRTLDDKIDCNRRLASLLEETVAAVFRARFVDFVGVEEFDESEIGRVPVGWSVGALADIGVSQRQLVRGESELPYIGLDLMPRGSTVLTDWLSDDAPTGQAATFDEGDILFGKLRPYFRKVGVAPISGRCSTEILVLRAREPELYGVLLGHVASQAFIDHCSAVSRGTRMPRAEWKDAGAFRVAIPPAAASREFSDLARINYAQIRALTMESRALREIRDAVLPRLVAGEIRVPATGDSEAVIDQGVTQFAEANP
jgi:type I restriction enzyme S subunit